uniref:helix-turn-helix domain-containing protein n=1 Tax=Rhodothermus marinus TaxID=29549 RepID=UPI00186892AF|nr:helix-turn-helix domain-containing protein [Rhodothermus marinus]
MIDSSGKSFLTVQEFARKYGIAETTVRRRIRRGLLPAVRVGRRVWLIVENAENEPKTKTPAGEAGA